MNMIKRLFCLLVVVMMVAAMLPATALAVSKEAVNVENHGLSISGYPNSALPIGSGYRLWVEEPNPGSMVLKLSGPSSAVDPKYDDQTIYYNLGSQSYVIWNGITITRSSAYDGWTPDQYCTFNVVDDDSDTTVSSNNITLLDFTKRKITKNQAINPTFQIVDYNVEDSEVASDTLPYLTGYNSNASFSLLSTAKDRLIIERVPNPASGKFTFKITLPLKYTGTGNSLSFTLAYRTDSDSLRTLDCTTTIPYTEEYKDDDDDDDDDNDSDSPVPYIIVDSYSYGGNSVTAGDEFTLKLRLRNTSTTNSLVNIVMNISPMGVFSMASSSNTFFINQLQAGSVIEREITLKAGLTKVTDDDDANSIDMKFTYQYAGTDVKKLESGTSNESITLPVDFPDRFELGVPESDDAAYIGEDFYISVPMVNKGRSGVYNLTAFVRGDGLKNPGQTQYIGNLNAGTESSADFSLQYLEPGDYSGEIVVTYEDANMNPKEMISVFNVTVEDMWGGEPMEPEFPDGFDPNEPAEPTNTEPENDPVRPVKIVVGLIVCAMSAYVTIQKAKAKRSIYLDEDL
ncbi:hypothetical protein ACS3UN_07270 [Oscillospiraceae bacterium LTW-04]|nr:hypothetical protein RBH76_03075 [Oscillospiraceae bacterium MB24-C1]